MLEHLHKKEGAKAIFMNSKKLALDHKKKEFDTKDMQ